jgi:hypothetical protein
MSKSDLYNTLYEYLRHTDTKAGARIRRIEHMQWELLRQMNERF